MSIIPVKVPCAFCGKEYDELSIDGHITYLKVCNDCLRDIVNDWADKMKESIDDRIESGSLG